MKLQKGYVDLNFFLPVPNTTKWWVVSTIARWAILLKKKKCIPKLAKQMMLQSFGRF